MFIVPSQVGCLELGRTSDVEGTSTTMLNPSVLGFKNLGDEHNVILPLPVYVYEHLTSQAKDSSGKTALDVAREQNRRGLPGLPNGYYAGRNGDCLYYPCWYLY